MRKVSTLLIIGCGNVGSRLVGIARRQGWRVLALTSRPERVTELRALGAIPLLGDLDDAATLTRLAGLADAVAHLAPPPTHGLNDPRTRRLVQALARRSAPARWVYVSTTGVYGDCQGAWVDEWRLTAPQTDRARRRVDAEATLRHAARVLGNRLSILRAPGIYALDGQGSDPRDRIRRGTPVLEPASEGYTNHVHAEDLARLCWAALWRGKPMQVIHAKDDADWTTGAFYDRVADAMGAPRPERITWDRAQATFSPMQLSFLAESRRLRVSRRVALRWGLRYPTVVEALSAAGQTAGDPASTG